VTHRRASFVLALVCAGCSPAVLPTEMEAAYAREAAHDPQGALTVYKMVRADCERPGAPRRPHDDCALAVVREAQLEENLQRWRDAYETWLAVPKLAEDKRKSARALARAAELADEELHDSSSARTIAWQAVSQFPDEVPSDDALHLIVKLGKRGDPRALAAELEQLFPRVEKTDLGDNVLFELAELYRTTLDDPGAAVRTYDRLASTYARSSLRDDALWRAAQVERAQHQPDAALKHLRALLATRRDAYITGSYNSEFLDDAELLSGQIYLEDLHDVPHAIEHFQLLADDYPESILRDDALYELARATLQRHAPPGDADRAQACAALLRVEKEFPDGNRIRASRELAEELKCR
jgi:hypothetical protein